ncbi:hypothetical protein ACC806_34515 [Rhizobium ruizarguesonis]
MKNLRSFADLQGALVDRNVEPGPVPDVARFVREGFVTLTAPQMSHILRFCEYEHQRKINRRHIEVLSDLMVRGQWGSRSTIDFARLDNGRLILVNGYHRAYAQVHTNQTIEWTIVIHDCPTMEELGKLYYRFDTNALLRSDFQILSGVEFAQAHRLQRETARSLFRAIPFIASNFSTKDKDVLATKVIDRRLKMAEQYASAALAYEQCVGKIRSALKAKMMSAGCMAVAVVTLRYNRDIAIEFWTGTAQNDGLRKGDPRQTLHNDFLSRPRNGHKAYANLAPAAIAWNAFYNERELRLIRIGEDYQCSIEGTPFVRNAKRREA